jgi:hypothetical protein
VCLESSRIKKNGDENSGKLKGKELETRKTMMKPEEKGKLRRKEEKRKEIRKRIVQ